MPDSTVAAGDRWAKQIEAGFKSWVDGNEDKPVSEWGTFDLKPYINGATLEGVKLAGEQLGELGLWIKLDLRNPYTEAWIKQYAAQEIKYIDSSSKAAIKQIILKGQEEGLTPQKQFQAIRQYIGLDPRRATALYNYGTALRKAGAPAAEVTKALARYRQQLINDRAENIGLTEGHTATNEGYRQANAEAVKRGVLDPEEWERYWIVTRDKHTCDICNALAGETATLPGGSFGNGGGKGPIRHNRCRCTEGLRRTVRISKDSV